MDMEDTGMHNVTTKPNEFTVNQVCLKQIYNAAMPAGIGN